MGGWAVRPRGCQGDVGGEGEKIAREVVSSWVVMWRVRGGRVEIWSGAGGVPLEVEVVVVVVVDAIFLRESGWVGGGFGVACSLSLSLSLCVCVCVLTESRR